MKTIDRWQSQLVSLRSRARELCGQLKEQSASALSDKHRISQLQAYEQTIQSGQARVVHAFESLTSLTSERQLEFESALSQLQLLREVSELEIWIAEKSAVAVSHELGTDIDHCCVLRDRFLNFVKLTVPDGTGRLSNVNNQCIRLIARGHSDAAAIALAKDSVNEAWADLLELIETRKQLLKAAWDMHHFVGDCQSQLVSLRSRARELCGQLKEQSASALSDKHRISQLQAYEQTIQSGQARVVHAFESLTSLTSERQLEFESALSQLQLLREVSELEIWIAEKSAVAVSHELGTDIDHCCVLRDRFLNFVKLTVPDGTGRLSNVNNQCIRLIARGHSDAAAIALAKDSVNEAWADLLELIETRKQLLKAAWDMHHFVGDCQDTEERIMFRIKNLPQPPTADLISGRKQGLSICQRSHANLLQELDCLNDQLTRLSNTAKQLFPRYAGAQEEQLKARYDRVQASWQRLHTIVESRNAILKLAGQIHRFLMSARELIMWLEMTRDQMEAKERPRDTHGVEILINEHLLLKGELETRSKSIDACLDLGRGLLRIEPPDTPSKDDSDTLVRPIGEVRERCVQLATGHLPVQELWRAL
ncbi:hypothetical protein AHF37_08044 [Paragonimus kellicotti]|nr:hypothetical protein AHF37_08044 [Paragonimus kellicotti]